jgi:flagellar basal-body rod modification protein FlgD
MITIDPTTLANSSSSLARSADSSSSLDSNEFLQLLLMELRMQDPENVVDQASFLQQIAALSNVQQTEMLKNSLADLTRSGAIAEAATLIGRHIEAVVEGQVVQGTVEHVTLENGLPRLVVDGQAVPVDNVRVVR